ncbi:hypothetical protein KP509_20G083700 [Ceratopteris richardii]|nr:hypothetical protein KP509_20G083700 [Ceratopteris richardii]
MNTFLNQTAMTGYPANELTTLFENPLTSMAEAMESRNSDGCLSNDSNPNSDDSGMNSRDVDAFPHVCENWKEARAQIFFGNYDCYQGVRCMPFASNEEIRNPRIDFEGDYMQPHSLVQEDKSLIRGGLPSSDYTQFCFPRPVLGPNPYYDYSTYKPQVINDMSSCRPAFCTLPWGNEVPDRYTDNKHQSDMSGSRDTISASSYASSGIVIPQASASVKSENGMDVCHMVNWLSNAGRIGRKLDMVPKDGNLDARCVQLFTECAEELVRKNANLASATLARLRDMVCHPIHTMQRVITYFMEGLQLQIEGVKGDAQARAHGRKSSSQGDFIAAFQILHEIFPYIKFGHFTANQAILEAVEGADKVHIVDFEILEGIQWPAFMQALVLRKGGPPEVRITALCWPTQEHAMDMTQKTCKRLAEFASTMNLPFSYNLLMVNNDENIDPSQIKVNQGEALVVNCMVHLPHMPQHTMAAVRSFVHAVKKLSPLVITLVEEELGCSAIAAASFFSEALHHFHAICDSLEACLPSGLDARILVERVFVAPRINSAIDMWIRRISPCPVYVAGAGDKYKWSTILHSAGLKPLPFSFHNQSQAKLLLGLHKDGFKLVERSHHLALAWQTRPLYAASVWK